MVWISAKLESQINDVVGKKTWAALLPGQPEETSMEL
jgi:hypothetical protein